MSQLLDSRLDEERLRDCLAHDAHMRRTSRSVTTCLDDAEACLHAARRADTAEYVRHAIFNLHAALWNKNQTASLS